MYLGGADEEEEQRIVAAASEVWTYYVIDRRDASPGLVGQTRRPACIAGGRQGRQTT
jgi:hypothetical protein